MSDTNSHLCPAITGTAGFSLCRLEARSIMQMFRSLAADLRRPFGTVVVRFNGGNRTASNRQALSPFGPSPSPEPTSSRDLSTVDSKELIREILPRVGEDPDREGLQETPARMVRSWEEIYHGYAQCAEDVLVTQFQAEQYNEMVLLRDIEFFSMCEHHMLPFHGKAHIGYLPHKKIVGLSKLARLTDVYARRLQVQERLTYQIATALQRVLKPQGVAVMLEAMHQCMCSRGARKPGGTMVTSCLLGAFKENPGSRAEFLTLVKG